MKLNIGLIAIALSFTGAYAATGPDAEVAAECGDLGVMTIDPNTLSDGLNASDVRKCTEHPEGRDRDGSSLAPEGSDKASPADIKRANVLAPRAAQDCEYRASLGCSKDGYCWRTCGTPGDGRWCWTAGGDGTGPWLTCDTYADCNPQAACGVGGQDCESCGCSC